MRVWFLQSFLLIQFLAWTQSSVDQLNSAITKKDFKTSRKHAELLTESEISENRAFGYWGLGVVYLSQNPDSANFYLTKALDEKPSPSLKLKILSARANYFDITGETKNAINHFLEVIELAKEHDPSFLSGAYNNLSISYRTMEQYDSAVYFGLEGLAVAQNLNQNFEIKRLYNSIAISFATQGDLDRAGEFFRKSLNQALVNGDSSGASKGFVNLTQLKIYQKQIDSAEFFLGKAKMYNIHNRNVLDIVDMYSLLAEVEKNEMASIKYLEKALDELGDLSFPSERVSLLMSLSRAHIKIEDFTKSQLCLDQAWSIIEEMEGKSERLPATKLQKEILVKTGKYREAIELDAVIDSLVQIRFNLEQIRAVEDMREKYETAEKERQILRLEQDALISELRIRQRNLLLLIILVIAFLSALVGYSIYRNRMLKLSQQRLLMEQRLLRSQMNPHFLFNALASINAFIFKGEKLEASEYLTNFSELTRDILNFTSSEWVTLEQELNTLEKYVRVQQLRFPEIDYQKKIQDNVEVDALQFPPLLLQPFIENAIEHGFKGRESGEIELSITGESGNLIIEIVDNGKGLAKTSNLDSKAIQIAKDRLNLLYGSNMAEITVKERGDTSGVIVSIVLPKVEVT